VRKPIPTLAIHESCESTRMENTRRHVGRLSIAAAQVRRTSESASHLRSAFPIRVHSCYSRLQRRRAGAETHPMLQGVRAWPACPPHPSPPRPSPSSPPAERKGRVREGLGEVKCEGRLSIAAAQVRRTSESASHLRSAFPIRVHSRYSRLQRRRAGAETRPTLRNLAFPIRVHSCYSRLAAARRRPNGTPNSSVARFVL